MENERGGVAHFGGVAKSRESGMRELGNLPESMKVSAVLSLMLPPWVELFCPSCPPWPVATFSASLTKSSRPMMNYVVVLKLQRGVTMSAGMLLSMDGEALSTPKVPRAEGQGPRVRTGCLMSFFGDRW